VQRSGGDGGVRRRDLLQQVRVGDRVLDVGREVSDLALTAGALEMVVDPANKQLLGRQQHQVVQGLAVLQQRHELLVMDEVDRRQQTDLHTTQTYLSDSDQRVLPDVHHVHFCACTIRFIVLQ